jgi:uncharacterized protein DUF3306
MRDDEITKGETFLGRWARLKRETASAVPAPPAAQPAAGAMPELPPLDQLGFESDFKAFLHPKVDERLRREALKKLFGDTRFNQMDGLDVYIDDYTIADPLPEGMLERLTQYRTLLRQSEPPRPEQTEDGGSPEPAADTVVDTRSSESDVAPLPETEVACEPPSESGFALPPGLDNLSAVTPVQDSRGETTHKRSENS